MPGLERNPSLQAAALRLDDARLGERFALLEQQKQEKEFTFDDISTTDEESEKEIVEKEATKEQEEEDTQILREEDSIQAEEDAQILREDDSSQEEEDAQILQEGSIPFSSCLASRPFPFFAR